MIKQNSKLSGDRELSDLVRVCEAEFEARFDEVCREIIESGTRIIALSGPTCSGKTTTAGKLTKELTKNGSEVSLISIDNFFRERECLDREAIMASKTIDYDSVDAIDLELLASKVRSLMAGEPTDIPVYDFTLGKSTSFERIVPSKNSVFLFEGIQAIYPEVTALFGDGYKSVYICPEDDVEVGDAYFGKREIRLMRRLVRDYKFRSASPEFTFFLWRSVAANEDRSILPNAENADIRINSFLPYEIYLMSAVLPDILALVPDTHAYYPKAYEIMRKLSGIDKLSPELVPAGSMLREFIG